MTVQIAHAATAPKFTGQNVGARAIRDIFETLDAESCPRSFNFHLHTVYSDGQLTPEELIEQAISLGLQGLAITDHHNIGGYLTAHRWLETWKSQYPQACTPQLWSGVEINADLLKTEVHILAYGFNAQSASLKPYLQSKTQTGEAYQAANVIAAIHQAGGLAVLAHPCRYRRPAAELIPEAARWGIDGVETYYAYTNPNPWAPSLRQMQQVQHLAEIYGLLSTCGTDTHGLSILQRL